MFETFGLEHPLSLLVGVFAFGAGFDVCVCCGFLCGSLRLCVCFCASRGVLTLMTANWPLMVVNVFLLALLAMVVNALWVWLAMVVNGFATAPGCRFACLGLGAPLGFQPAIVK